MRGNRPINVQQTRGESPSPRKRGEGEASVRPDHLEHGLRTNFKIIAPAAGAHDRAGEPGLVDAVPDHGLVDVDGDDFAEREPGLRLLAVSALQLDLMQCEC